MKGSLTTRIKNLEWSTSEHLVKQICKLPEWERSGNAPMLNLPKIWPQYEGIFMDYLVRRVVWEARSYKDKFKDRHIKFYDNKCKSTPFGNDVISKCFKYNWLLAYSKFFDDLNPTEDIIFDVLVVSAAQGFYRESNAEEKFMEVTKWVCEDNLEKVKNFMTNLKGFVSPRVQHATHIRYTPALGDDDIPADADLLIGTRLVDIKTINHAPSTRELYQLLGYATLAWDAHIEVDSVEIWNFYTGDAYTIDIGDWHGKNSFYRFLTTGELVELTDAVEAVEVDAAEAEEEAVNENTDYRDNDSEFVSSDNGVVDGRSVAGIARWISNTVNLCLARLLQKMTSWIRTPLH
jgi:hypothetical protein